jgi:hypothetical protein
MYRILTKIKELKQTIVKNAIEKKFSVDREAKLLVILFTFISYSFSMYSIIKGCNKSHFVNDLKNLFPIQHPRCYLSSRVELII